MIGNHNRQNNVRSWFESKYRESGLSYLRPREAYYIFLELLDAQPGKKILDIACGPGLLLSAAKDRGLQMYGADISLEAIKMCNSMLPQANVNIANAESLPYSDNHFDYIICLGSLERFLNVEKALSEQLRVAKEDARFCYMVRNADTFTWRFFMKFLGMQNHRGHQDARSLKEWKRLFYQAGLEVAHISHDHWPYLRFLRWITLGNTRIDYCKIRSNIIPMRYVNEFIFVLKKRAA